MTKDQKKFSDIKSNKKILSWTSPEFIYQSKNKSWYTGMIVIAIILIAIFYWQKMYSAMAVVAASILALFTQARLKPKDVKYTLSSNGLEFNSKKYTFNDLKSFWMIKGNYASRLYLKKTGRISNPITIELIKVNAENIRNFLKQYLPEDTQQGEHINERVSRFMKF